MWKFGDDKEFYGLSEYAIIFKKIHLYGNDILEIQTAAFAFQEYIF
jgi:hypothetical protein